MELKGQDEIRQYNQNFILVFLLRTAHLEDELAECMKATISQFMHLIREEINEQPKLKEGFITEADLYTLQINSLRECIISLEECLKLILTGIGELN